jgi:L-serine dehydratase
MKRKITLSSLMIEREVKKQSLDKSTILKGMTKTYTVMRRVIESGMYYCEAYNADLTGDIAGQFDKYLKSKKTVTGSFNAEVIRRALSATKSNSMMNVIVAAPTAGSSGVLPAVLTVMEDFHKIPREKIVMSLFTAGLIAMVIADTVTLAGAVGGCMAECGSAAAMAAATTVELMSGTPEQCSNAAALALKQHLGVVCDPIAGLVECPCIKRNAMSATVALSAAEMSLADIKSVVPFDEVLIAMKEIAEKMDVSLRETSIGGLAATPTGKSWQKQLQG